MAAKYRERVKKFSFRPFPYALTVVVSNDINQARTKRIPMLGRFTPDSNAMAFVNAYVHRRFAYMFLPEDADTETITHEVNHVIWFLEQYVEADFDKEVTAYYNGYYTREVVEFVYKHKMKKRKKKGQTDGTKKQRTQRLPDRKAEGVDVTVSTPRRKSTGTKI